MKNKGLKTKNIVVLFVLTVLLSACSELFSPTKIYSPEAISTLATDLKRLSEDYLIEDVQILEKDNFSGNFGDVAIHMRDKEGRLYFQSLYYNMNIPHYGPDQRARTPKGGLPHAINIEDIVNRKDDFGKYAEAAKVQFKEEFESDYKFKSIGKLQFNADKSGELQLQISIFATEKGKATTRQEGRRIVTDYYEFIFNIDKNGTVIYKGD